jgi:hypothetical protein
LPIFVTARKKRGVPFSTNGRAGPLFDSGPLFDCFSTAKKGHRRHKRGYKATPLLIQNVCRRFCRRFPFS